MSNANILPPQKDLTHNTTCGICESIKVPTPGSFLECPHCDKACTNKEPGPIGTCGVCKAGMKGLPERGMKWPDGGMI